MIIFALVCNVLCECPSPFYMGTTGNEFGGVCYELFHRPYTWYQSRKYCLDAGGDLASVKTENVSDFITHLLSRVGSGAFSEIYIGGHFQDGDFHWVADGSPFSFRNWESPGLVGDCVCLRRKLSWRWDTCNCKYFATASAFICQTNATRTRRSREWNRLALVFGLGFTAVVLVCILYFAAKLWWQKSQTSDRRQTRREPPLEDKYDSLPPYNVAMEYS